METVSAWDRAVEDFCTAWQLSTRERTALRVALNTPMRSVGLVIREVLVEAAGLSLEIGNRDFAAWCYTTCERVSADTNLRPTWDEIRADRALVERISPAVRGDAFGKSLAWWAVRLFPTLPNEAPRAAQERRIASALYLVVRTVQEFVAEDIASRERAGLVAALGVVIARQLRAKSAIE